MKVIVGVTSWKKRISTASLTLKSILEQTVKADSIELNLDYENFPNGRNDLPNDIVALEQKYDNFHIFFEDKDYRVWLKSVPSVRRHSGEEYVLFTLDDDCTYYPNYIEESLKMLDTHASCDAMNTSSNGIAGEYMVYRSRFLEKCLPYLTNEFISKVRVDDCCWFWFFRKFKVVQAPRVDKDICKDRMQGFSYRRVFNSSLPNNVKSESEWTKMDGEYPMGVLQEEMRIIQYHLGVK
jgi:hypothetical protein